jgi:hypothetical protein
LEKELTSVGEDCALARGNAVGGQEDEKVSDDVVNGKGGVEARDGAEEVQGEGCGILAIPLLFLGMVGAERGMVRGAKRAARASLW